MINKFTGEKQDRFVQFLDRMIVTEESELSLLEEIFSKADAGISAEEMENTFYSQCAEYFEIIAALEQLNKAADAATEYRGVLQ